MSNETQKSDRLNFSGEKPLGKSFLPTDEQLAQSEAENGVSDGSKADVITDVEKNLSEEVADTDAVPETVAEAAPVAVAENVATVAAATSSDADSESLEDLRRKQDELNRKIEAKRKADHAHVLEQIKTVMADYGVTLQEVVDFMGGLKKTRKASGAVKPKYRNSDTGETWTGRGRAPVWIRDKNKDDYLIKE